MPTQYDGQPPTCPPWCELGHGAHTGEDDTVHIGGQLCVRNTLVRLCCTVDPETGQQDGPYVLMGSQEFDLPEVDDLVEALSRLAAEARDAPPRAAGPDSGTAVLRRVPTPRAAT